MWHGSWWRGGDEFYEQMNDSTLTKFDAAERFALFGSTGSEGQGQRLQRFYGKV